MLLTSTRHFGVESVNGASQLPVPAANNKAVFFGALSYKSPLFITEIRLDF